MKYPFYTSNGTFWRMYLSPTRQISIADCHFANCSIESHESNYDNMPYERTKGEVDITETAFNEAFDKALGRIAAIRAGKPLEGDRLEDSYPIYPMRAAGNYEEV